MGPIGHHLTARFTTEGNPPLRPKPKGPKMRSPTEGLSAPSRVQCLTRRRLTSQQGPCRAGQQEGNSHAAHPEAGPYISTPRAEASEQALRFEPIKHLMERSRPAPSGLGAEQRCGLRAAQDSSFPQDGNGVVANASPHKLHALDNPFEEPLAED